MKLNTFLSNILSMQLTQNEITVLLELGYSDFTRDDLLSSGRCAPDTYSPSALTKTLQKLSLKNPAIITNYQNSNNKNVYRLIVRCETYADYEGILLEIARSKLMTLNTTKVALQLILNGNMASTARYLGQQLSLDPDYLASTVLPRMIVLGIIKPTSVSNENNHTERDLSIPSLAAVNLNIQWSGKPNVILL